MTPLDPSRAPELHLSHPRCPFCHGMVGAAQIAPDSPKETVSTSPAPGSTSSTPSVSA